MYKFKFANEGMLFVVDEDVVLGELNYSLCEGNVVIDWVSISDDFGVVLGKDIFGNYFSMLKNIGECLKAKYQEQGIFVNRILWGDFPPIKELNDFIEYESKFVTTKLKGVR